MYRLQEATPGYIQWIDPSNVSPASARHIRYMPVGNVRGPAYANVDLSLHKGFLITESKRLEFRFEALNAFNHPGVDVYWRTGWRII